MIQTLFAFLPAHLDTLALIVSIAGAAIGAALWLCGSRYSRTLVTLLTVSLGMILGLQLPKWFGWRIEGWATGVLVALIFGVTGYAWHKVWIGMGLGLVLACWAAIATFAICGFGVGPDGQPWTMPVARHGATAQTWFIDFWNSLGAQTRRTLPFACATALISGLAASVMWPRFGTVLLYSTLGVSLLVGLGVMAMMSTRPQWLGVIPNQMSSQMVVLTSLVAFGAILQWRVVPAKLGDDPRAKHDHKRKDKEKKH